MRAMNLVLVYINFYFTTIQNINFNSTNKMWQKSNCFLPWKDSYNNLEHQILGVAFEQLVEYPRQHVGIDSHYVDML